MLRALAKVRARYGARQAIWRLYAKSAVAPVTQEDLLSIVVPVFNAKAQHLDALYQSFVENVCPAADLIFVDDGSDSPETISWLKKNGTSPRTKIIWLESNGGIATALNAGIVQARGRWITFLDHDDMIAPHGLNQIATALRDTPEAEFLYTDELLINERNKVIGWFLKPAYDPILLSGVNYINHFSIFRADRLRRIGQLKPDFDGSQDYEILLRYLSELEPSQAFHLPYPAYWWRRSQHTFSRRNLGKALTAARRALKEHVAPPNYETTVTVAGETELHKITFHPKGGDWPSVGVVIPNRDAPKLMATILRGLFEKTDYQNIEVVVVDDGSSDAKTLALYDMYRRRHNNFRVIEKDPPFNFSRSVNLGMAALNTDHVLLANNDIEVRDDPGWLKEMVSCMVYNGVGIVGAKLLFADGTLQHGGVIVGQRDLAGHWFYGAPAGTPGPMGRLWVRNSMLAVTGALMLISKDCAKAVGSWDEDAFAISFNDVDYCIRAHDLGFRTVWTPFACLTHLGSATRLETEDPVRSERERTQLQNRHKTATRLDPASSPFFSRTSSGARVETATKKLQARAWFSH